MSPPTLLPQLLCHRCLGRSHALGQRRPPDAPFLHFTCHAIRKRFVNPKHRYNQLCDHTPTAGASATISHNYARACIDSLGNLKRHHTAGIVSCSCQIFNAFPFSLYANNRSFKNCVPLYLVCTSYNACTPFVACLQLLRHSRVAAPSANSVSTPT